MGNCYRSIIPTTHLLQEFVLATRHRRKLLKHIAPISLTYEMKADDNGTCSYLVVLNKGN